MFYLNYRHSIIFEICQIVSRIHEVCTLHTDFFNRYVLTYDYQFVCKRSLSIKFRQINKFLNDANPYGSQCVCVSVYIVYIVQVLENLSVRALMSTFARSIPFAPIEMCFPIHGAHIEDALNIFHYLRSSVTHVFPHEDQFQIRQIPPIKLKSP